MSRDVTPDDLEAVRRAVRALPPMTDDQIDGICLVVVNAKQRWAKEARSV